MPKYMQWELNISANEMFQEVTVIYGNISLGGGGVGGQCS